MEFLKQVLGWTALALVAGGLCFAFVKYKEQQEAQLQASRTEEAWREAEAIIAVWKKMNRASSVMDQETSDPKSRNLPKSAPYRNYADALGRIDTHECPDDFQACFDNLTRTVNQRANVYAAHDDPINWWVQVYKGGLNSMIQEDERLKQVESDLRLQLTQLSRKHGVEFKDEK